MSSDPVLAVSGPTRGAVPGRDGSWPTIASLLAHLELQLRVLHRPSQRAVCRTHLHIPFDSQDVAVSNSDWRFAFRSPNARLRWALGCTDACPVTSIALLQHGDALQPDPQALATIEAWLSRQQTTLDVVAVAGFPQRDAAGHVQVPLRVWLPRLWLTAGEPLGVAVVLDRRGEEGELIAEITNLLHRLQPMLPSEPPQACLSSGGDAPVAAALQRLQDPALAKLVVGVPRRWPTPQSPRAVEQRVVQQQATAWICSFSTQLLGDATPRQVVCASPELLVRTAGEHIETLALAGTLAAGQPVAEHLQREHQLVVDYLGDTLQGIGIEVEVGKRQLREAGPLLHLATPLRGRRPPGLDALTAALHLHPTPALLGLPRPVALATVNELEVEPRGWYGGFAGIVSGSGSGEGEFAVLLRGAEFLGEGWRSWAGAGLVATSTSAEEHAEIRNKHNAIGRMLGLAGVP